MSGPDARIVREVLWHLRGSLDELVLIGGWVPHLYRTYGPFPEWRSDLALTEELDVLVENRPARPRTRSLGATLSDAGFAPVDEGAAVWKNALAGSQRIEFLTPHRGVARDQGTVVRLEDRPRLGALALDGLELLRDFTNELEVPVGIQDSTLTIVNVRVPTLGTYALNKAITFPRRPADSGGGGQPRRAKDILYLRDVVSAGPEVVKTLEEDVRRIAGSHHAAAIGTARSNLYLLLRGAMVRYVSEAAEILSERDRVSQSAARTDIEGHITDLHEILEQYDA